MNLVLLTYLPLLLHIIVIHKVITSLTLAQFSEFTSHPPHPSGFPDGLKCPQTIALAPRCSSNLRAANSYSSFKAQIFSTVEPALTPSRTGHPSLFFLLHILHSLSRTVCFHVCLHFEVVNSQRTKTVSFSSYS